MRGKRMAKYRVSLELAAPIIVEAASEDRAGDKALEEVYADPDSIGLVIADITELVRGDVS
jgi:hypothetical protein